MKLSIVAVTAAAALLLGAAKPSKNEPAKPAAKAPTSPKVSGKFATEPGALAPLPPGEKVGWSHAPFEGGSCSVCHERDDVKNPGPLTMPTNELCFTCHEEHQVMMKDRSHKHASSKESCSNCHNSHNSREMKLLLAEPRALCLSCHEKTAKELEKAKVHHAAVDTGTKCMGCHNPHASNVEKLLVMLPFDLCISCHSTDDLKDDKGVKLTNFKKLLENNPIQHGPVAAKDCSACHTPHASENFRLLTKEYPAQFYAPYDPQNYALCFECHNDQVVAKPETGSITRFRDGSRNLHYLHVNKADRGRTCRACHEVHASKQPHHIRESVPYGAKGWALKIEYLQSPVGGSCAKTCHATKAYVKKAPGKDEKDKGDKGEKKK